MGHDHPESLATQPVQVGRVTIEPARHGTGEPDKIVSGIGQRPVGQFRRFPATPAHVQAVEVKSPDGQREGPGHLVCRRLGELGERGLRIAPALGPHRGNIVAQQRHDGRNGAVEPVPPLGQHGQPGEVGAGVRRDYCLSQHGCGATLVATVEHRLPCPVEHRVDARIHEVAGVQDRGPQQYERRVVRDRWRDRAKPSLRDSARQRR